MGKLVVLSVLAVLVTVGCNHYTIKEDVKDYDFTGASELILQVKVQKLTIDSVKRIRSFYEYRGQNLKHKIRLWDSACRALREIRAIYEQLDNLKTGSDPQYARYRGKPEFDTRVKSGNYHAMIGRTQEVLDELVKLDPKVMHDHEQAKKAGQEIFKDRFF